MVLSKGKFGTFFSVNFGWGIGVTLGCYWAGGISGVHLVLPFQQISVTKKDLVYSDHIMAIVQNRFPASLPWKTRSLQGHPGSLLLHLSFTNTKTQTILFVLTFNFFLISSFYTPCQSLKTLTIIVRFSTSDLPSLLDQEKNYSKVYSIQRRSLICQALLPVLDHVSKGMIN